jgi:zinc/manganese transport system substrate-binding protein
VQVRSILSNPNQDPHLFEASPAVARAISGARIVVYSGIDYDPWMETLLAAARAPSRRVIDVAALAARRSGDNPHVWYDTETMLAYAAVLTEALADADPAAAAQFRARLAQFQHSLQPVQAEIAALRDRLAGASVTATEPIFGYVFDAIGLHSRNQPFQLAVMNGAEPSASAVVGFERDLRTRAVRLLVYNSQVSDPTAERMRAIAAAAGVPAIGASETEPPGVSYQDWMRSALDALGQAMPR